MTSLSRVLWFVQFLCKDLKRQILSDYYDLDQLKLTISIELTVNLKA